MKIRFILPDWLRITGLIVGGACITAAYLYLEPSTATKTFVLLFMTLVLADALRRFDWKYSTYFLLFLVALSALYAHKAEYNDAIITIPVLLAGFSVLSPLSTGHSAALRVRLLLALAFTEAVSVASLFNQGAALKAGIITVVAAAVIHSLPFSRSARWSLSRPFIITAALLLTLLILTLWTLPE